MCRCTRSLSRKNYNLSSWCTPCQLTGPCEAPRPARPPHPGPNTQHRPFSWIHQRPNTSNPSSTSIARWGWGMRRRRWKRRWVKRWRGRQGRKWRWWLLGSRIRRVEGWVGAARLLAEAAFGYADFDPVAWCGPLRDCDVCHPPTFQFIYSPFKKQAQQECE